MFIDYIIDLQTLEPKEEIAKRYRWQGMDSVRFASTEVTKIQTEDFSVEHETLASCNNAI